MQTGDLLFVRGTRWVSRVIQWVLKSEFSHVAIVWGEGWICEIDVFQRLQFRKNPHKDFEVYRLKEGLTLEQMMQVRQFLIRKVAEQQGYDWWRILSFLLQIIFRYPIVIDQRNKVACSEIGDQVYQFLGIDLIEDRSTGDVTPPQLQQSKQLTKIPT